MTNLTRKNQKVFASGASNNGQFGSLQATTKVLSNDVETLQALAAYEAGWNSAVVSGEQLPSLEEFQALNYINTYQTAYLLQKGFPEWNTDTTYYIGDLAREVGGTKIYKSITDSNSGNALTDIANWEFVANFSLATTTSAGAAILPSKITIANNSADSDHDIDFAAGNTILADGSGQVYATAETKQIDSTWAAGSGLGGMASGLTVAPDTTYHCFALASSTNSFVGFGFDTSKTAANLLADPAVIAEGGTKYKRVASVITDGAANIIAFFQTDNFFFLKSLITDISAAISAYTTRALQPLTTPSDIETLAIVMISRDHNSGVYIHSPDNDDQGLGTIGGIDQIATNGGLSVSTGIQRLTTGLPIVKTDSSSQVYIKTAAGFGNFAVKTQGWIDYQLD